MKKLEAPKHLRVGGAVIERLETSTPGVAIHTSVAGIDVAIGRVALDDLLRFLGPSCGILPADWENEGPDAKPKVEGPVCVGGPFDGRRVPVSAHPMRKFLVPVRNPLEICVPHPGSETTAMYSTTSHGSYELIDLTGPTPDAAPELRQLWWYVPPRKAELSKTLYGGAA